MTVRVIETYKKDYYRHGAFQFHAGGCNCNFRSGRRVVFHGQTESLENLADLLVRDWLNEMYGYEHFMPESFKGSGMDEILLAACLI
jgi:hypothetical protein